jgi:hypothetical protein
MGRIDIRDLLQLSAEYSGSLQVMRMLLKDPRIDPTVNGNAALLATVRFDNENVFSLLFNDSRVKLSQSQLSMALILALKTDNTSILDNLLSLEDADPNPVAITAVMTKRYDVVSRLLPDRRIHPYFFSELQYDENL